MKKNYKVNNVYRESSEIRVYVDFAMLHRGKNWYTFYSPCLPTQKKKQLYSSLYADPHKCARRAIIRLVDNYVQLAPYTHTHLACSNRTGRKRDARQSLEKGYKLRAAAAIKAMCAKQLTLMKF